MATIVVIGAGAIGCFLAARLHRAGDAVTLVAREAKAELLLRNGVAIAFGDVTSTIELSVAVSCAGLRAADFVLICTKMDGLAAALELAAPVISGRTVLVTVQNGVEAHELVSMRFPRTAVIASRIHGFFEMDGNRIRHVGVPPSLVYGQVAGPVAMDDAFGAALARAGMTARQSADIVRELWEKFLLAASLGGVGLAIAKPGGAIHFDPQGWALLRQAMQEVEKLAAARGVTLTPRCVEHTLSFVETFPPDATTSMQRDVEAGLSSEYDALTGAVLRLAKECGLDLPGFAEIERLIRQRGLRVQT